MDPMSFTGFGVVAGAALTEAVRRAGADHVEPTIAGNLAVPSDDVSGWTRNEVYAGGRFGSFAILVPGALRLLTADPDAVRAYFAAVLPSSAPSPNRARRSCSVQGPPARRPTACPAPRPSAGSPRCSARPGTPLPRPTCASSWNR